MNKNMKGSGKIIMCIHFSYYFESACSAVYHLNMLPLSNVGV